jgi:Fungal specific transcription factor domain
MLKSGRYVGLGSTISVIDACPPFGNYLERHFERRRSQESQVDSATNLEGPAMTTPLLRSEGPDMRCKLPPNALLRILAETFFSRLYFMMPVISESDFHKELSKLNLDNQEATVASDFLPILFGVLAMAALSLPSDHQVFNEEETRVYRESNMAADFFQKSLDTYQFVANTSWRSNRNDVPSASSLNSTIAVALQAAYLSSTGCQAEAWIGIGQAARFGQDIGLHVGYLPDPLFSFDSFPWRISLITSYPSDHLLTLASAKLIRRDEGVSGGAFTL